MHMSAAVTRLTHQGVVARWETIEYSKDVHGWAYDREKYVMLIKTPFGDLRCVNYDQPTIDERKIAALGLALASLGDTPPIKQPYPTVYEGPRER